MIGPEKDTANHYNTVSSETVTPTIIIPPDDYISFLSKNFANPFLYVLT
jgi:hypothetical protein